MQKMRQLRWYCFFIEFKCYRTILKNKSSILKNKLMIFFNNWIILLLKLVGHLLCILRRYYLILVKFRMEEMFAIRTINWSKKVQKYLDKSILTWSFSRMVKKITKQIEKDHILKKNNLKLVIGKNIFLQKHLQIHLHQ